MQAALRTILLAALVTALSPILEARAQADLHPSAAPRAGALWLLDAEFERPLASGAVLFGARGGEVLVLGLAGPDGRFRVQLPEDPGLHGLSLAVWAEAPGPGARWRSKVLQVTVDAAGFDPSVDRFAITGCSLGCSGVAAQITCSIVNTFVNPEIALTFSQPVALASATPLSFQVIDLQTGVAPPGHFYLDPQDTNTLVYAPQLSFDPLGNPIFGFQSGRAYQIRVSGKAAGDPGPYVSSITGAPCSTRLLCSVVADQGVMDYVPGPPTVALTPAGGATGVPLDTDITLAFDDVMNLATLVIPLTGQAPFITVLDGAGSPIAGAYSFEIDTVAKTTTVDFTPAQPLPPGETIQVGLPAAILDLVGNPLSNAGNFTFTTAAAD